MKMEPIKDVAAFHRAFNHPIEGVPTPLPEDRRELRVSLILEEVNELVCSILGLHPEFHGTVLHAIRGVYSTAAGAGQGQDLVGIADGIADSIYVIVGTGLEAGIPMAEVWSEVQAANIAKAGGETRDDGKTLKPPDWKPPDIAGVLDRARYREQKVQDKFIGL